MTRKPASAAVCSDCDREPFHCTTCHYSFTDRHSYDMHLTKRGSVHYMPHATGGRFIHGGITLAGDYRYRVLPGSGRITDMPFTEIEELERKYAVEAQRAMGKFKSSADIERELEGSSA